MSGHPPLTWTSTRVVLFRVLIIVGAALAAGAALTGWAEGLSNRELLASLGDERTNLTSDEGARAFRNAPLKRAVRIGALAWHTGRVEARLAGQWTTADSSLWAVAAGLLLMTGGEAVRRRSRSDQLVQ